jgi:aminoglycoside phosphotransferase (APT) family kinase protein
MPLTRGTRLRSYEIIELIGAGGMGEVYRARDLKLKRDVAIKVLPDAFSRDEDRLRRFQREAEVLASLNHPGIAGIHELGESDDSRFLVLELIEGDTLADRIRRGRLPVPEAARIAKQIAEALEAAHAKGVVHRDLKPANIKLTHDGKVKILDFGLAKIRESAGVDLSNAPTLSMEAPGAILGTPAYMSPEQVHGENTDRLADIWAFGCVLYEMLTALRLFEGKTTAEVLANVLNSQPAWDRLPEDVPENIRRLLRRCLQRDRADRLRDVGDARLEITEAQSAPVAEVHPSGSKARTQGSWARILAASVLLLAGAAAAWFLRSTPELPEMRLEITTPSTPAAQHFAISPDGKTLAFVANNEGRPQLWLRALDADAGGTPVPNTDFAGIPFWSPDSRFVGFTMEDKLLLSTLKAERHGRLHLLHSQGAHGIRKARSCLLTAQAPSTVSLREGAKRSRSHELRVRNRRISFPVSFPMESTSSILLPRWAGSTWIRSGVLRPGVCSMPMAARCSLQATSFSHGRERSWLRPSIPAGSSCTEMRSR